MRILITAGPTREYLDSVRFISNASSGLTGFLTAAAAAARGHHVTLVAGPTTCERPKGVKVIPVVSAQDMYRQVLRVYPRVDVVIMTAAVGDYRPATTSRYKQKKGKEKLILELIPTPDILAELGRRKTKQVLIGFALEDRAGKTHAMKKFTTKNLDAILLNSPRALGSQRNQVQAFIAAKGWEAWPAMSKQRLGKKIIRLAEALVADIRFDEKQTHARI